MTSTGREYLQSLMRGIPQSHFMRGVDPIALGIRRTLRGLGFETDQLGRHWRRQMNALSRQVFPQHHGEGLVNLESRRGKGTAPTGAFGGTLVSTKATADSNLTGSNLFGQVIVAVVVHASSTSRRSSSA